jgi:hypothetical protein
MLHFPPVYDGDCFPEDLGEMMKKGEFQSDADVMAGFTQVEGFAVAQAYLSQYLNHLNASNFR